jgi:spore maturation protein CgeB
MSYRFVKISIYYKELLNYYYSKFPDVINEPYEKHFRHFMGQGFGWSDYFQTYLKQLGVEAYEIVLNSEPLQKAWAKEHNIEADKNLLIAQLKEIKPDVILIHDFNALSPAFIKLIKEEIPGIKKIIGYCCSPFSLSQMEVFKHYDFVLTCSPLFARILGEKGIMSYYFPHAFETSLLPKIQQANNFLSTDFIFIGSFIKGADFHDLRIKVIEELVKENIDLTIYSNIRTESAISLFLKQFDYLVANGLKKIGLNKLAQNIPVVNKALQLNEMPGKSKFSKKFLEKVNRTQLFGIDMLQAISKAKIGFNIHGGIASDYAANIRMFEVTGAGSLLLTDNKKNIRDFFEPDYEIVTYSTAAECIDKTKWLLNNPEKIKAIADAGHQRCTRDHNIQKRVALLNEIILKNL